jgi:Astacin (Peptidase family M12A)
MASSLVHFRCLRFPINRHALLKFTTSGLCAFAFCIQVILPSKSADDYVPFAEIYKDVVDRAFPLRGAIWFKISDQFRQIPVCWEHSYPAADRFLVQEAIKNSWQAAADVTFTGWQLCVQNNEGIRIVVEDLGPNNGPNTGKFLGNQLDKIPNGMSLNFTFKRWNTDCAKISVREMCIRKIAIHEFGHALGFAHEQNRRCTSDWCNTPDWCQELQPPQGGNGDDETLTPWDPKSVMNYCNYLASDGLSLSGFDVYAVQELYGKRKPQ